MLKTKCFIFFLLSVNLTYAQTKDSLSAEQRHFYEKLINAFRKNSIESEKIDWNDFEKKVLEKALISKDSAISLALELNGNPHTFYKYPNRNLYNSKLRNKYRSIPNDSCPEIDFKTKLPDVGYVKVEAFIVNNPEYAKKKVEYYVNQITDSIESQDKNELKGWIIDLRENGGGNMWPMLIALTPFYPEGTLGYFRKGEKETRWSKMNNQIFSNSFSYTDNYFAKPIDCNLKNRDLKIAVLVGNKTCSAGEAVAVSTKSIKNARLFGSKTFGFATANISVEIADGEFLVLTTSVDVDVNKVEYWDGIIPDFDVKCDNLISSLQKWFDK